MAIKNCRACGATNLAPVIDLGMQPPSNAFKKTALALEHSYPLRAVYCASCFLMQTDTDVPPTELFGDSYVYFSQNSQDWLDHTKRYCDMAVHKFGLDKDSSIVLEIGGNDGHLLVNLKDRVLRAINIEPSASVAKVSEAHHPLQRGGETPLDSLGEFFQSIHMNVFKMFLCLRPLVYSNTS